MRPRAASARAVERARAPRRRSGRRCGSRRCSPARRSRSRCARPRSPCSGAARRRCGPTAGSFPGPTIRRPAGERDRGHLRPHAAGEGGRAHGPPARRATTAPPRTASPAASPAASRGRSYCRISDRLAPGDSGNDLLIAPGGRRTYTYDLIEDGGPERAAFQWYHDHRLERTAPNVWRGLAGMMIIDDELEASLPLPTRRSRHPADDRRPLRSTSETSSPTRSRPRATRPTTGSSAGWRWSTASTSPTTGSAPPVTGSGSSTPPTSASTTSSSPTATTLTQIATESGLMPRSGEPRARR